MSDYTIAWHGSPNNVSVVNSWVGRNGKKIQAIVSHIMQGSMGSTDGWFKNPAAQASAHFGISFTGAIYQWVREEDSAWANGIANLSGATPAWLSSLYKQGVNINNVTVSIEHEGFTGNVMPEAQYQASLWLQKQLITRHGVSIDREHLIGHYQIDSVNRPNCPGTGFSWTRLVNDLNNWATNTTSSSNGGVVVPNVPVVNLNNHVIGHGFLTRYLELGGNDLNASIRNVGLPLTEEVTGPDGLTRQVFERYVMEYDPKETNEFWKVRGAFAGASWLDENGEKLNLKQSTGAAQMPLKGVLRAGADPGRFKLTEDGDQLFAYRESGKPEEGHDVPKMAHDSASEEAEPEVNPERAQANKDEEN